MDGTACPRVSAVGTGDGLQRAVGYHGGRSPGFARGSRPVHTPRSHEGSPSGGGSPAPACLGSARRAAGRSERSVCPGGGESGLGLRYPALPDDLLNFHWDPAAYAAAVGWPGAVIRETRLETFRDGDLLRFRPSPRGRVARVVVD